MPASVKFLFFVSAAMFSRAAFAAVDRDAMMVGGGDASANGATDVEFGKNFLASAQSFAFSILGVTAVIVFIYLGFKLFSAQGNEEEFRKTWKALVYAVVGLALIPASYAVVKIVTGFDIK